MLKAHNDKRKLHCVKPLTWSADLARGAQAYASKCNLGVHASTQERGGAGENMALFFQWKTQNGVETPVLPAKTDAAAFQEAWYCEIKNYNFNSPKFEGGFTQNCKRVNGHFTQVVWKDTTQLGCGRAICDVKGSDGKTHKGTSWVCRYSPSGNMNTSDPNVLKQQVLQPKC